MTVKLLTEDNSESLSFKGDCTGSLESTHVKMPHCWKSHVKAHIDIGEYSPSLRYVQSLASLPPSISQL